MTKQEEMTKRNGTEVNVCEQNLPTYRPRVDIVEDVEKLMILADMPGVDEKGVEIELEGHELRIRGKSVIEAPAGMTASHVEYPNCHYERQFTLGDAIDREAIQATMKNGVLQLRLPKVVEAKPQKIRISAG